MARILLYDVETAPDLAYVWARYQTDVVDMATDWYLLCFAWKWLGEKGVHSLSLPECRNPKSDKELAVRLHELFNEADVVVAHNGHKFDQPKARTRMIVHGLDPPSPVKEVDTLMVARTHFRFSSNKLDDLARQLGVARKGSPGGFATWLGCMNGDPQAWARMIRYCRQDVRVLEDIYLKLRPWMPRHPNLPAIDGKPDACPACGSTDLVIKGKTFTARTWRQRYACKACGHWTSGAKTYKTEATTV